jgi:fibronectin type 3 domain-containing protein
MIKFTKIPMAPSHLKAEADDRKVRLTWKRPFLATDGTKIREFSGYWIYRTSTEGQYTGPPIAIARVEDTSFVDTAVTNGETYYYVIQSVATTAETAIVGKMSAEVAATPTDRRPPNRPTNLSGVTLDNTVKLFWNLSQTPDWQGFNVYRGNSPDGPFERINAEPVAQPSYNDVTAEAGKVYFYSVTSFDNAVPPNESPPSDVLRITVRR